MPRVRGQFGHRDCPLAGVIALLVALVALAPTPTSAALTYHTSFVCSDISLYPFEITQRSGSSGIGVLETSGANVQVKFKASGLPASSPVGCAVACVVDGVPDLFNFEIFEECTTTGPSGKMTFNTGIPLGNFNGGCLLPVMAFLVLPEEGPPVVCAPGFGTFGPFPPPW